MTHISTISFTVNVLLPYADLEASHFLFYIYIFYSILGFEHYSVAGRWDGQIEVAYAISELVHSVELAKLYGKTGI
jgi:hypothetical protein